MSFSIQAFMFLLSEFAMTPSLYIKYTVKLQRTQNFDSNRVQGTQIYHLDANHIFLRKIVSLRKFHDLKYEYVSILAELKFLKHGCYR